MAKLFSALLLCVIFFAKDSEGLAYDETCVPGDANSACDTGLVCDASVNKCRYGPGAACDATSKLCEAKAFCEASLCKLKDGEACATDAANCIANAGCVTATSGNTCQCNAGYTASTDKTVCNKDTAPATTKKAGEDCTASTECDASTAKCDGGVCRLLVGQTCTVADGHCVSNAECSPATAGATTGTCTCKTNYQEFALTKTCTGTIAPGTKCETDGCVDGAVCEDSTCKSKVGSACVSTANTCVANAECPASGTSANKCTCKSGFTVSAEKDKCSGAIGLASSLLLVLATLVTSRFI